MGEACDDPSPAAHPGTWYAAIHQRDATNHTLVTKRDPGFQEAEKRVKTLAVRVGVA